jgi:hypothetical protein
MRFYTSLLLFFFILFTQNISAANSDFNSLIKGKKESIIANPQGLSHTLHSFSLEKERVIATFSELDKTLVLDNFPIGQNQLSTVELTFSPSSVDSRTKVFIGNQQIPLPFVSSFIGSIHNEPGSSVLLTTSQGNIYCWIMRSSGEQFVLTPSHTLSLDNEHHILSQNEFINDDNTAQPQCLTDEKPNNLPTPQELFEKYSKGEKTLTNTMLELPVIVESTSSFFNGPGRKDSISAVQYIIALFNGINSLYRKELNVNIIIPKIIVWTASNQDPYQNDGSNTPALLQEVESRWNTNTNDKRAIVHCLDAVGSSGTGNGTFVLGIANGIGNICDGAVSKAYSVSGIFRNSIIPSNAYSKDIVTIAHELGHNIGAYHTHNCWFWKPALDSCLTSASNYAGQISYSQESCNKSAPKPVFGSIMSYCHLTNNKNAVDFTFLPRVYTYLRQFLESKSCIQPAQKPQVNMIYPWGGQTFVVGKVMSIEWTSVNVQTVTLEYSINGGQTWETISKNIPAISQQAINGQGIYNWNIPNTPTTQGRIRVYDQLNPIHQDTSWVNFSIEAPTLNFGTDLSKKVIGIKELVPLAWTKKLVDKVKLEISIDAKQSWQTISASLASNSSTVNVPDITAKECFFKVTSLEDSTLFSITGPFELAKEQLTIILPKPNDTLCVGKQNIITWKSENIAFGRVNTQYSTNNGASWTATNTLGNDAVSGLFNWQIDKKLDSSRALIRIVYKQDTSLITSIIPVFITSKSPCSSISSITNIDIDNIQSSIIPNPAEQLITITLSAKQICDNATISLFDIQGRTISIIKEAISINNSPISLQYSVEHLSAGVYYISITCEHSTSTIQFTKK